MRDAIGEAAEATGAAADADAIAPALLKLIRLDVLTPVNAEAGSARSFD